MCQAALKAARDDGDLTGQAHMLRRLAAGRAKSGRVEASHPLFAALAAMRAMGARRWEGAIWDSLGYAHHQRGDYQQALACYERAVALSRDLADRFNEADTLSSLGDVHQSTGDTGAARRAWREALRIFAEIDHPDRDKVRAKLRQPVREVALAGR